MQASFMLICLLGLVAHASAVASAATVKAPVPSPNPPSPMANTVPNPTCFGTLNSTATTLTVSNNITVNGTAGTSSISFSADAQNWVIKYSFPLATPTVNSTVIQLTLLQGTSDASGQTGTSLQNFTTNWANHCDQNKNLLNFFFLWGNATAPTPISTQPTGTTVIYESTHVTISMPIETPKLVWTNTGKNTTYQMCKNESAQKGGIYLATRIYTKGKYNATGIYPACNDDMPAQTYQFIPSCSC